MTPRTILRAGAALVVAAAVSGCQTSVGVGYGYSDPFYWNHYYHDDNIDININRPDRPDRPERPPGARPTPPIAKPPIAKPPSVRPPIHRPSRPSRPGGGGGGRLR